jgi:hypothetical protein
LLHHLVAVYQSRSERLHLPVQLTDTLTLLLQHFHFAGHWTILVLLKAKAKGFVLRAEATALLHQIGQRLAHLFPLLVRERHFVQARFQFFTFALVVLQTLFVLAQFNQITAMLALPEKIEIDHREPSVQPQHQDPESAPPYLLPTVGRHHTDGTPTGKFLCLLILLVQTGEQPHARALSASPACASESA